MKGLVTDALKELVIKTAGREKWEEIMTMSNEDKDKHYAVNDDTDEAGTFAIFGNACQVLGMTMKQAGDAYGDYWVNTYIPDRFPEFFRGINSTKDFLLRLDDTHRTMERRLDNAKPPKHQYHWINENTLELTYDSFRDAFDLFVGAIKGIGRRYNEDIKIEEIDRKKVHVTFPS